MAVKSILSLIKMTLQQIFCKDTVFFLTIMICVTKHHENVCEQLCERELSLIDRECETDEQHYFSGISPIGENKVRI